MRGVGSGSQGHKRCPVFCFHHVTAASVGGSFLRTGNSHTLMRHDELPGSPDNEGGLRKGAVGLSQCSRNPIGLDRENKKMEKVPTFKK
jgi:hypothetical protein